ncbi:MAG TPA: zinc dependent phospholipase C family protein, partial [Ktedonobacteraceae bacterium]|nr:zinc dependent phospholipase C family protein [Ktedonobacteraceae bacterium]
MPAFLTHWRILIETARHSQDAGSDLGSLIVNAAALRRRAHGWSTPPLTTPAGAVWDTGPLPEIDFRFPGSDISAMAFIGALAPDILYYHRRNFPRQLISAHQHKTHPDKLGTKHPLPWSELFHTSHSGDILVMFLEQVALVPSPAMRSQALAFALGYVSHIATDLALNPWIEVLAARLLPHRASAHFLVELRLDEYLATTYFEHPRYSMLYQPWGEYIEPAAQSISQSGMLAEQILQLFAMAAEVYHLSEEQIETLPHDFLAGLQGLRHFLAGRGKARWLTLLAGWRHEQQDLISKALAEPHSVEG